MFEDLEKYVWGLYNWFDKKRKRQFAKIRDYWLEIEYREEGGAWIGMGKDVILLEALVSKDKIEYICISDWEKFKEMYKVCEAEVKRLGSRGGE